METKSNFIWVFFKQVNERNFLLQRKTLASHLHVRRVPGFHFAVTWRGLALLGVLKHDCCIPSILLLPANPPSLILEVSTCTVPGRTSKQLCSKSGLERGSFVTRLMGHRTTSFRIHFRKFYRCLSGLLARIPRHTAKHHRLIFPESSLNQEMAPFHLA